MIQFLPGFLVAAESKESLLVFDRPLRTEVRLIPTQLVLGTATDYLELVSEICKDTTEAVVLENFFFQAIFKNIMGAIYIMTNSF
jgi:hypothetical protein